MTARDNENICECGQVLKKPETLCVDCTMLAEMEERTEKPDGMHLKRYQREWVKKNKTADPIGPLHGAGVLVGERIGITAEREKVLEELKRLEKLARSYHSDAGYMLREAIMSIEAGDHAPWGKLKGDDDHG